MRLPVNRFLPLAAPIFLAGCLGGGGGDVHSTAAVATNGPAADYPVIVGEPFTIGSITYTPEDKLNYDAVGYASVGQGDGAKVAAAHKTLPLPSYIEVTELANGKTALVRVETRGPMRNDMLVELTPGAAAQLGITGTSAPVRVRRVNPAEVERATLRAGEQAPLRIDTPESLVAVLKRKLDSEQPAMASASPAPVYASATVPAVAPVASHTKEVVKPTPAKAPPTPVANPAPKTEAVKPTATPASATAPQKSGKNTVQIGTFSTRERAETAAKPLGGTITPAGRFWVVTMGPFNSVQDAAAALEKARKSGYRDAIVRRID